MKLNIKREIRNLRIAILVLHGNTLKNVGRINNLGPAHIRTIFYKELRKFRRFNEKTRGMPNPLVSAWRLTQIREHFTFITLFTEYAKSKIITLYVLQGK